MDSAVINTVCVYGCFSNSSGEVHRHGDTKRLGDGRGAVLQAERNQAGLSAGPVATETSALPVSFLALRVILIQAETEVYLTQERGPHRGKPLTEPCLHTPGYTAQTASKGSYRCTAVQAPNRRP